MVSSYKGRIFGAAGFLLVATASIVWACQVPVFRYALERWEADRYSIVIKPGKSGELSADETKVFEYLKETEHSEDFPANFFVKVAESASPNSEVATLDLIYPKKIRGLELAPIWSGAATLENAKRIVDSPVRREIVTQLLKGQSAVWILLEGPDEAKNQEAESEMLAAIGEARNVLKIPEGVLTQEDLLKDEPPAGVPIDPENILQSEVPLKIDFSVVRMKRDDPAEAIFLQMLVNLEDDLADFSQEPMVFPVFGRGRMLEPLIGKGINENNTLDYAGYLCGACSCEVKDLNPGMDLLVAANWGAALEGSSVIIEKVLPPLEGMTALTAPGVEKTSVAIGPEANGGSTEESYPEVVLGTESESVVAVAGVPFRKLALIIGAVLGVIAVASIAISRKKSS